MNDKERIELILKELRETSSGFAKKLGIHPTNIYHIISGRNGITERLALLICSRFKKISYDWVAKGIGDMYINEKTEYLSVGNIAFATEDYEYGEINIDKDSPKYNIPGINEGFLIRVRDDSMSPMIRPGDFVTAREMELTGPIIWGKTYIVTTGKIGIIRKLLPGDTNDQVRLTSFNNSYPDFIIKRSDITQLAKIVGVVHLE